MRSLLFGTVLPLLLVASQLYWIAKAWEFLGRRFAAPPLAAARFLLLTGIIFLDAPYLAFVFLSHPFPQARGGLVEVYRFASAVWTLGAFSGFLVMIFPELARSFARRIRTKPEPSAETDLGRRRFLKAASAGLGLTPWVITTYGVSFGRLLHRVERVPVFIPDLPEPYEGYRIVQLTDIHISEFMPAAQIERYVEEAAGLGADLAVLTGDYLGFSDWGLEDCVAVLSQLSSRAPVLGCLGNHEIFTRTESRITRAFERRGVAILRNQGVTLERNGARLRMIGCDYQRLFFRADPSRHPASPRLLQNLAGLMEPGAKHILLSHNPNVLPAAARSGIDLTLAGHTHGGQVRIEILDREIAPSRFISPYVKGLYHLGRSGLYVSRGIGTTGPPLRLGAPPEITLIELRRA